VKISVRLSDPLLGRALIDLLRANGHEVCPLAYGAAPSNLSIQSDILHDTAESAEPTLLLYRGGEQPVDAHPSAALRAVLEDGGTAVWDAPLDVALLLEVLGDASGPPPARPALDEAVPDLDGAPHPWMVIDVARGMTCATNAEARALLDLPSPQAETAVGGLPLAGALREALREQSEGLWAGDVAGVPRTAAWWTSARGRRVVCFLEAPTLQSPAARNRQSLAELGEMAATLAHEIRNPVASLAGALDLLETEEDPTDRAEVLAMARERLKQLARLLEKTLNLARPIGGPTEIVDLDDVVASAVSTLSFDPRLAEVEMCVHPHADAIAVRALQQPLLQALTNILLNAGQAMEGDGRIDIHVSTDTRRAMIRVHDSGPGVPQEKRQEIFKPFYTTKPSGTGLGLAEVRRAMEAIGGAVIVEDVDTGACFRLELPRSTASHEAS